MNTITRLVRALARYETQPPPLDRSGMQLWQRVIASLARR